MIHISNNSISAGFDETTGALVELSNPATGWSIIRRRELGLSFSMVVPLADRLNHRVFGRSQKLTRFESSSDGRRLTLVWDRPISETGLTLDITFTGVVELTEFGLAFSGELANRGSHRVDTIGWPCVGELSPPGKQGELCTWSASYTDLHRRELRPSFRNQQGYWGADYPTQTAHSPHTSFVLVGDDREGFYVGHHCTTNDELVQFLFELKPGPVDSWRESSNAAELAGEPVRVQMTLNHFPFAATGATAKLTPIVFRPYSGTWHKGVDCYKRWRATWHKPAPTPDWCKRVHSWQQIQINSIAGEQRCRYRDLVEHGRQCAKHGVETIQLTGWTDNGQDGRMPSHDIDPRLGTREELRQAIADLRAMGVRTILYEKFVYADVSTDWYKRELRAYMARDIHGNVEGHSGWAYFLPAHFAGFNMRRLDWGCMHHPQWRRVCREEFARSLDLDADGVLIDESCHPRGDGRYCFAPDHGHLVPAFNPRGDNALMAELNALAAGQPRQQVIVGEATHDLQTAEFGMTYFRIADGHIPGLRYIDPFYPMMVAATGYDDREKLNACLMYRYVISYEPLNFKGKLDDFPLTIGYGRLIDDLRRRYQAQLWDAIFEDTLGATVTAADGKPHKDYSVFRQPTGRRTVVVANHDRKSELAATVRIDGYTGPVTVATPERPDKISASDPIIVPPRSAVVVFQET
jgi:hypothetical protein